MDLYRPIQSVPVTIRSSWFWFLVVARCYSYSIMW